MAEIKDIYLYAGHDKKHGIMRVYGIFRAIGEKMVEVKIPMEFYNALLGIAQCGIDAKEAEMRAEILATNQSKGDE